MAYPSTITAFSNPIPSDRLNSPSHSSVETAQNTGLTELQTYIGVTTGVTASAAGTLLYDIKAPDSDGGGHVQTANKGGTGQTSFTKGNILVAANSSTLSKLAVGTQGQILAVDNTTDTGLSWSTGLSKVAINTASILVSVKTVTVPMFATSILGSTLSTNNGVRFTGVIRNMTLISESLRIQVEYGNNVVASVTTAITQAASFLSGTLNGILVGNGGISSQLGYVSVDTANNVANIGAGIGGKFHTLIQGSSSVESSATQNLIISATFTEGAGNLSSIATGMFVVEKII